MLSSDSTETSIRVGTNNRGCDDITSRRVYDGGNPVTNDSGNMPRSTAALTQGVLTRAVADGISFLKSVWFLIFDAGLTFFLALATYLSLAIPLPLVAISAILVFLFSPFLVGFALAPYRQRNEVREELAEVHERLRPELRIVNTLKSYELEGERVQDYVYIEYLRLLVSNESDSSAINCKVSLLSVKPKLAYLPTIVGNTRYSWPDPFEGYPEPPYPISLTWSDYGSEGPQVSRDISLRGQAQVSAFRFESGKGLFIAFATQEQSKQFRLPETEIVFSLRVDSDNALPRFYVLRYRPNVTAFVEPNPSEILQCGDTTFDLEQFREKVQTPTEGFDDE